jgi:hypothetical protein
MSERKNTERTFEVVLELRYIDTHGTVIRDGIVAGGFQEAMALYRRMLDASRDTRPPVNAPCNVALHPEDYRTESEDEGG